MSIDESSRTLSVLSRALTHVIRGDLSVITNDLAYLGGAVSEGEVERAKARCANIAQFVGKLAVFQNGFIPQQYNLRDFTRSCLKGEVIIAAESSNCIVRCDLQQAGFLFTVVSSLAGSGNPAHESRFVVDVAAGICTVRHSIARTDEPFGQHGALADFASGARGERSLVDAAIADLILQMHGWTCGVLVADAGVEISIRIPIAR